MDNNENIKKFNRKLLAVFIIVLTILGTLLTVKSDAVLQIQSLMSHFTNRPSTTWMGFSELKYFYDIFCCEKDQHIPSDNDVILSGSHSGGSFEYSFGYLTANDKGKKIEEHTIYTQTNDFSSSSYEHETFGFYRLTEHHVATPAEAYVLSEMAMNEGKYATYVQLAWWNTPYGSLGKEIAGGDFSQEADSFEEYMKIITKTTSIDQIQYEEQNYSIIEDNVVKKTGSVTAPVIDYNPQFNEDADQNGVINQADEVTKAFDYNTQKYVIGPFSIDYVKRYSKAGSREKIDFSCIIGSKLVAIIGGQEKELEYGKDWDFKYLANQARDDDEDYIYPNPNEVFYIETKYQLDLTKIVQFSFDFKYMNAGAIVDKYEGTYSKCGWTVDHKDYYVEDDDGDKIFDHRDIWLELTSLTPYDSQVLAHGLKGARWYEYKHIEKNWGPEKWSTITIDKETIGEDGDRAPINKTYRFKIYIDDVNGEKVIPLSVKVRNGHGKATTPKIWWDSDVAPTYEIEEVGDYDNDGPWSGTLEANRNIRIYAENYIIPKSR